jgi:hypothetical protein
MMSQSLEDPMMTPTIGLVDGETGADMARSW